jgi:hypothetical protein
MQQQEDAELPARLLTYQNCSLLARELRHALRRIGVNTGATTLEDFEVQPIPAAKLEHQDLQTTHFVLVDVIMSATFYYNKRAIHPAVDIDPGTCTQSSKREDRTCDMVSILAAIRSCILAVSKS